MAKNNYGSRYAPWIREILDHRECTVAMRQVLGILGWHVGKSQAISGDQMIQQLQHLGWIGDVDRQFRDQINKLRKLQAVICSAGGPGGGYWIPDGPAEFEEYLQHELHSRAMDLLEQEKQMRAAAERIWGKYSPEHQLRLEL